jgi:hypothetical protein
MKLKRQSQNTCNRLKVSLKYSLSLAGDVIRVAISQSPAPTRCPATSLKNWRVLSSGFFYGAKICMDLYMY